MRGALIFLGFIGLSAALHALPWIATEEGGSQGAGDGGAQKITLAAAPGSLAQMVERWQTPVAVSDTAPSSPTAPDVSAMTPPRPAQSSDLILPRVAALAQAPDLPSLPEVSTVPAPPPPKPVVQPLPPRVKPKPRPSPKSTAKPKPIAKAKPAPKAAAAAPSRAAERAKGKGATGQAGKQGQALATAQTKAQTAALIGKWGGAIRAKVERSKKYPRGTKAKGKVVLHLTLTTGGKLAGVRVTRSSGVAALDQAALRAAKRTRLPKAPKGLSAGKYPFKLTLGFARK